MGLDPHPHRRRAGYTLLHPTPQVKEWTSPDYDTNPQAPKETKAAYYSDKWRSSLTYTDRLAGLYLILYLLENVVPHPDVEQQFHHITEQLRCRPYLVDAKDGGLISRPRMWWQNIRWETAAHMVHQYTPWHIIQTFQHNTWHLHNPIAALLQPPRTYRHLRYYKKDNHSTALQPRHPLTRDGLLPSRPK